MFRVRARLLVNHVLERDRRLAEKEAREVVADSESALAQHHVRQSMRKNKLALVLFALILFSPVAFLGSFYFTKMGVVFSKFQDPYQLPDGFDPKTGEFTKGKRGAVELPKALTLGNEPGSYLKSNHHLGPYRTDTTGNRRKTKKASQ